MIRFIDLRGQDTGDRFAFFDTVTDKFVDVLGVQTWDTQAEFIEWCNSAGYDWERRDRMVGLMPEWTKTEEPE